MMSGSNWKNYIKSMLLQRFFSSVFYSYERLSISNMKKNYFCGWEKSIYAPGNSLTTLTSVITQCFPTDNCFCILFKQSLSSYISEKDNKVSK